MGYAVSKIAALLLLAVEMIDDTDLVACATVPHQTVHMHTRPGTDPRQWPHQLTETAARLAMDADPFMVSYGFGNRLERQVIQLLLVKDGIPGRQFLIFQQHLGHAETFDIAALPAAFEIELDVA